MWFKIGSPSITPVCLTNDIDWDNVMEEEQTYDGDDGIDYDALLSDMLEYEKTQTTVTNEPKQLFSKQTITRKKSPAIYDFSSKSTATLGGSNAIFRQKVGLHDHFVHPKLSYAECTRHVLTTQSLSIHKSVLATFEHYMSSWFVIKLPPNLSSRQMSFIEEHKALLTVKERDFMSKDNEPKDKLLYVLTPTALILPREYSLTLYGPSIFFAYSPSSTTTATQIQLPQPTTQADAWRKLFAGQTAHDDYDPITPAMVAQRHNHLTTLASEPNHPAINHKYTPVHSIEQLPPECWTGELQLNPDRVVLRKQPVDQLHVVLMSLYHWHNAILHPVGSPNTTKFLPNYIVIQPCGTGKTIYMLACWTLFNSPLHLRSSFESSYEGEQYDHLRSQQYARKTVKALFVVHTHTLIEQACETIDDNVIGVRIGCIEGVSGKKLPHSDEVDMLVISIDTLAQSFDKLPLGYLDCFPLLLLDEAHRNKAASFEDALRRLHHQFYRMSVTATMRIPYFDGYAGSVLFTMDRPEPPERSHTNMIVYDVGEKLERFMPTGTKSKSKPRMNGAAQTIDIYMDFVRHAWTAHLSIGGFVPSAWPRLFKDPLMVRSRLVRVKSLSEALGNSNTVATPFVPAAKINFDNTPVASSSSSSAKYSIHDLFGSLSSNRKNNDVSLSASMITTPKLPMTKQIIKTPVIRACPLTSPYNPDKPHREPIFFSTSIPHLIVQYLWQAHLYMTTAVPDVPEKYLKLVRIGARQIAVVDIRPMLAEPTRYAHHWFCLNTGNKLSPALPSLDRRYETMREWEANQPLPHRPTSPDKLDEFFQGHQQDFGHAFWHRWFKTYPPNEEWSVRLRNPDAFDAAAFSKPKWKKVKKTGGPTHTDPCQQPFLCKMDMSHRFVYWMYYWLPVYGPLQQGCFAPMVGGNKSAWRRELLQDDVRPPLPGILATFGLVIGKQYNIPAAIGIGACKISRAHEREALDSTFVFATDQLASTGIDKPRKCSSFEGMYNMDNEQCDGRCLRLFKDKQQVYLKNELIDPWSCYQHAAWAHHKLYRLENRDIEYYRIEKCEE